jgi:hypothetical protein
LQNIPCDFYKPKVYYLYKVVARDTKRKGRMKIRNINDGLGMAVEFDSVEEMEKAIASMGYSIPAGGLREGRDYESIGMGLLRDGTVGELVSMDGAIATVRLHDENGLPIEKTGEIQAEL